MLWLSDDPSKYVTPSAVACNPICTYVVAQAVPCWNCSIPQLLVIVFGSITFRK